MFSVYSLVNAQFMAHSDVCSRYLFFNLKGVFKYNYKQTHNIYSNYKCSPSQKIACNEILPGAIILLVCLLVIAVDSNILQPTVWYLILRDRYCSCYCQIVQHDAGHHNLAHFFRGV